MSYKPLKCKQHSCVSVTRNAYGTLIPCSTSVKKIIWADLTWSATASLLPPAELAYFNGIWAYL